MYCTRNDPGFPVTLNATERRHAYIEGRAEYIGVLGVFATQNIHNIIRNRPCINDGMLVGLTEAICRQINTRARPHNYDLTKIVLTLLPV